MLKPIHTDLEFLSLEQKQQLDEWKNTDADFSSTNRLVHPSDEVAERSADKVVVVYEDVKLTYQELNEREKKAQVEKLLQPYHPPDSVTSRALKHVPSHRVKLGNFPTPLHSWSFSVHGKQYNMLIKRDDLSDMTASGNKIRKLEFILPDILTGSHDWVLSLGPTQSNSCRALTAIAPRVGLRSAHVLVKDSKYKEDRPAEGNLFFHKLFGAQLFLISREEYVKKGQHKLLQEARERLVNEHGAVNPYLVPMGGNTIHGLFGYIEWIHELRLQLEESAQSIDEIFFSCGSGGTAAGLAIGKYLSSSPILKKVQLTGYVAWDTPEYFHHHVNEMLELFGLDKEVKSEEIIRFVQSKGLGYGLNTDEELQVIREVARSSGIVLDGTYTSKAVNVFIKEGRDEGRKCLFIHTGGLFSMIGREDV